MGCRENGKIFLMRNDKGGWNLKFIKWMDQHFEETLLGVMLVVITVIMFAQTLMRNVFSATMAWPEELARYCLVASTLFSFAYCIRKGNMLKLDILVGMLPRKVQQIIALLTQLISVWLYGYLFVHAIELYKRGLKSVQYSTALRIPMYIIYFIAVIAFAFAIFRQVQSAYKTCTVLVGQRRGENNA